MKSNLVRNFAEFFAGVGLVHEGLSEGGWECAWANDICSEKRDAYVANFGSKIFYLGDIWDCVGTPELIPDSSFLYTASFPCTDMSLAGSRKGLAGEESGTLNAVLEILSQKNQQGNHPYMVMLENVQGFLTSHKGADVAFTVRALNELGYVIDLIELDAIHFTPQSRPRVFLFAARPEIASKLMKLKKKDDLLDSWWNIFDSNPLLRTERIKNIVKSNGLLQWGAFDLPPPPRRISTLADVIELELNDNPHSWWPEDRKNYLFSQMSPLHKAALAKMISKGEYTYGTVYRRTRKGAPFAELRTDGVAGCLRTPRGGSSKQILIRAGLGDWSVRLLSPREYARLQGVGDHFALPSNSNKAYFAMGDAVCVPAIQFISKHILGPAYEAIASEQRLVMNHKDACVCG